MAWLDLTSPALQKLLYAWGDLRANRKVPLISDFEKFIASLPKEFSSIVEASDKRECKFLFVGPGLSIIFPGCRSGTAFKDVTPLTTQLNLVRTFSEVLVSRQPLSRRNVYNAASSKTFMEFIILPFVDANFNVRKLAVAADGYTAQ
jgi:hypothetical protein